MFCESHRKALSEAAASGAPLPRQVEEHLADCDGCRSAFAAEQQLVASIDSAMSMVVGVEVPASLLPRVRAQVAAVPERSAWRGFFPLLATASVVVSVFAVSLAYLRHFVPGPPTSDTVAVAPEVSSVAEYVLSAPPIVANPQTLRPSVKKEIVVSRRTSVHSGLEILVSADEQRGIERYAARLRARAPEFSARATVSSDDVFKIQPLEIAEIDLRQLTIEPLESGESY